MEEERGGSGKVFRGEAGEIGQSAKCLPCKRWDLSLIPETHLFKKLDMVALPCNLSTGEAGKGTSLGLTI